MTPVATPVAPPPTQTAPRPRPWTKAEYYKMWEMGWFEGQRVELLDGEIIEMPIPNPPHFTSTDKSPEALRAGFRADRVWVRMQGALDLGRDVEVEPDVAMAHGLRSSFTGHP